MSHTQQDWCIKHGRQEFFLGYDEEDNASIHCPHCWPNHPDNPANEVWAILNQFASQKMQEIF